MAKGVKRIDVRDPPFETKELRSQLASYLKQKAPTPNSQLQVGAYRWGIYAFFDYDDEPIYVGQTKEKVSTRIRRHLTNQRTDAVAMSVLDPFEVARIEVWPLPQFQQTSKEDADACRHLDALERTIYEREVKRSKFEAVLNEKDPPKTSRRVPIPDSVSGRIVSDDVLELRGHPDLRIARRSLIISRLAQVISEREVQPGLRRVLLVQAKRLTWLAEQRFSSLGGNASVPEEGHEETDDDEPDTA